MPSIRDSHRPRGLLSGGAADHLDRELEIDGSVVRRPEPHGAWTTHREMSGTAWSPGTRTDGTAWK
jgi:hypothetical protein